MNVEDIVWKYDNLDQKVVSNKKREENATIRQIHYHVKEVDDKTVQIVLTYQLTSSILTPKNDAFELCGNYHINCYP